MTTRSEEGKERESPPPMVLGYLQKAWEWQWALRLTYLLLFADLALLFSGRHGLLHFSIGRDSLSESASFLCLSITAFGLIASICIPTLAYVIRGFFAEIFHAIPSRWTAAFHDEPCWNRPKGCVTLLELRTSALEEKSDFLHRLYEKYDHQHTEARKQRNQAGNLIFGVLLLMLLDGMGGLDDSTDESIVGALMNAFHPWSGAFAWTIVILGLMALKWAWRENYRHEWIYYPPLYRLISASEERRKRDLTEFRKNLYKDDSP
ncbi:hypothetical protein [Burkholderia sp. BCC0405]|uniref:hypothetical protein n=1 Tax=Burkholderia sp. BCC0405 TaxID=2676298 RepID=UPI00158AA4AE|nr:hypothetical protein [Burkholderia sp. BCC0405]